MRRRKWRGAWNKRGTAHRDAWPHTPAKSKRRHITRCRLVQNIHFSERTMSSAVKTSRQHSCNLRKVLRRNHSHINIQEASIALISNTATPLHLEAGGHGVKDHSACTLLHRVQQLRGCYGWVQWDRGLHQVHAKTIDVQCRSIEIRYIISRKRHHKAKSYQPKCIHSCTGYPCTCTTGSDARSDSSSSSFAHTDADNCPWAKIQHRDGESHLPVFIAKRS